MDEKTELSPTYLASLMSMLTGLESLKLNNFVIDDQMVEDMFHPLLFELNVKHLLLDACLFKDNCFDLLCDLESTSQSQLRSFAMVSCWTAEVIYSNICKLLGLMENLEELSIVSHYVSEPDDYNDLL